MLDIKLIREQPDEVKRALATVGVAPEQIDGLLAADVRRRAAITEVERMRAQRAETSKTVGKLPPAERERVVAEMRALGDRISAVEAEVEGQRDEEGGDGHRDPARAHRPRRTARHQEQGGRAERGEERDHREQAGGHHRTRKKPRTTTAPASMVSA